MNILDNTCFSYTMVLMKQLHCVKILVAFKEVLKGSKVFYSGHVSFKASQIFCCDTGNPEKNFYFLFSLFYLSLCYISRQ